jgi:hypothetical protein
MQFLSPAWLWLALLALPILLLYMLKLRRRQAPVSSTLLWVQLLRDKQANTPWQKLRRNLLLLLQLLILAALVFGLARPAIETPVVASGSVVVLLDASASMNATDVSPSRFDSARRTVQTLIEELPSASRVTLILVAEMPRTLIASESDKSLLRRALDRAQVSQGGADWDAAFALAAGVAQSNRAETTTVIVSDGGLPQSGLPSLPGEVRYVPVGASDDNVAVSALALRPSARGPELFAEVTNYGSANRTVLLSVYFGNQLLDARQLDLPSGASQSVTLDNLQNVSGVYKVQISGSADSPLDWLALDDAAFAAYRSASARRVLLLSKGNLFLEQLLASLPGIQPFRALPAEDGTLQIPRDPFDLYIFDGIAPPELPDGNLLFVNPSSNPLFEVGAAFKDISNVQVHEGALTRYVDWSNVHVLQARSVRVPEWADVLIEAEGGPLVFAGEAEGRRVAALTFDLRESDLPLQIAFPILFSNLINYLTPPGAFDATQSLKPGEGIEILPPPDAERVVIVSPSNLAFSYSSLESGIVFTETRELGFYAVNFIAGDSTSVEYFAVNLFEPLESDLHPRDSIRVGSASVTPTVSERVGQRELWSWFILLALVVLLIEWQAYHRRQIPINRPAFTER